MSNQPVLKRKFIPVPDSHFSTFKKFKFSSPNQFPSNSSLNSSYQASESPTIPPIPPNHSQFTPTIPQPFALHTERRNRKCWDLPTEDLQLQIIQSRPKFKAKALPKFPPAPGPVKSGVFTVPQEFNLLTNARTRNSSASTERKNPNFFTARPCPDFSKKFEIKKIEGGFTVPQSFTFETAARQREVQWMQEEKFKFEALPLPRFYSAMESSKGSRAETENSESYRFTAKPMPNFEKVFAPVMNSTPTIPMNIELNTERRAGERERFEDILRDKENYMKELKELEERIEADDIKNFRKTLEFKARPLQDLKPFFINRSGEELTTPKSPLLRTKLRAVQRQGYWEESNSMEIDD